MAAVLSIVSTVVAVVGAGGGVAGLWVARRARDDSRRSADAAEVAAAAARDTARSEAAGLELERRRHHQELAPVIEVNYELAGGQQNIPMLALTSAATNPMTYTTVSVRLEDVQGRRQGTAGFSQLSEWTIPQMKPGDCATAAIYPPDPGGGWTRVCARFTAADGEAWDVSRILEFPPPILY